jgi:hypothetical protein
MTEVEKTERLRPEGTKKRSKGEKSSRFETLLTIICICVSADSYKQDVHFYANYRGKYCVRVSVTVFKGNCLVQPKFLT